jgi:hypothetical protein
MTEHELHCVVVRDPLTNGITVANPVFTTWVEANLYASLAGEDGFDVTVLPSDSAATFMKRNINGQTSQ